MNRAQGFSLVELLLIVALITIMTALALPQLQSYRQRSRRAEVLTNLAAIRNSENAYIAAHDSFTDNIAELGWVPAGHPFFIYGFTSDAVPAASGVNDTAELRAAGSGRFSSTHMIDAFGNPLTEANLPPAVVTKTTFQIGAAANLDRDADMDQWRLSSADNVIEIVNDDLGN